MYVYLQYINNTKTNDMKTYNFTDGKKETKTYKEISNKQQGCYGENEMIRMFKTDNIDTHENEMYDTRFEEVKN